MSGKAREAAIAAPESPALDVRLLADSGGGLLDMGDDSGFMNLTSKDLDKMNLVDTPPVRRIETKKRISLASPSKAKSGGRPSWGPKSSPTKGKMRLFEGLDKDVASTNQPPQVRRKERTLGGFGQDKGSTSRPRQSMFAKPSVSQPRQSISQEEANEKDEEGEESFYKDPALSSSTGSVKDRVAAIEASRLQADLQQIPYANGAESKEQMDNQLAELKKMNDVFEAYEGMLTASADQIEVSVFYVFHSDFYAEHHSTDLCAEDRGDQLSARHLHRLDATSRSYTATITRLRLERSYRGRVGPCSCIGAGRKRDEEKARRG
jgi:hypothetical protein